MSASWRRARFTDVGVGAGADFDTEVLVIGSGPAGSTAALALATYGVDVHVVTKWNWLANTPRAHITNQRAVEVLRDLDVEEEATREATPWELMGDMVFATSLTGDEIGRLRTWGTGEERIGDYRQGSPCPMLDLPQMYLEPVLVKNAAARGATFTFNTEYLTHEQDDEGVVATLRDRLSGREYTIRARYLIGADGGRSRIVEQLGLPLCGEWGREGTAYVHFEADLSRHVAHRPSVLYWLMTPTAAVGEIGMGLLRAIRPWNSWIAGWGYDVADGEPDLSHGVVIDRIREYVGDPNLNPTILSTSTWLVNQVYATRYSAGRVFCVGDAVHRHPPSSGLGSNTSIQDAHNLAWKLAFVLRDYADQTLLDSYDEERAPVGKQIVERANQSRFDYALLKACFRDDSVGNPVEAGLARLRESGSVGVAAREALGAALHLKSVEYNGHGTELNTRYSSSAILPDPEAGDEIWARDRLLYLQATTRPGAKLPHCWLVDQHGRRISTLDVVGRGRLCLMTGLAGSSWAVAVEQLALPYLDCVVIGSVGAADPYLSWAGRREIEEGGALLVRPDGYIAWRHTTVLAVDAAVAELRRVLDNLLHLSRADTLGTTGYAPTMGG
jgi:2,4-dichlorophenol 6-monooxygenase